MAKVYLLSDYKEYGSENMAGTMDKSKVIELLTNNFNYISDKTEYCEKLEILLEEDISSKDPVDLGKGWGGVQLHIIELI